MPANTPTALTVALATPLAPELRPLLRSAGVELTDNDELLPPQRFPGDHDGDPAFERTADQQAEFENTLTGADIWYGIPDNSSTLMHRLVPVSPRLQWVQTMAAGGGSQVKGAKLTAADLRRVSFTTSAGVHGGPLAEFALMGLLIGAKDLNRLQHLKDHREWPERVAMKQVSEQTVLIVGLGGIGAETARLVKGLGATVIGVKRHVEPVAFVDEVHSEDALPELVARADAIVFTLPGTEATRSLYGRELIAATKPGAVIVNVGRGTVIDEPALIDGLTSGQLGSACLDVTAVEPLPADSALWTLPNVVISPHTAALNGLEDRRIAELFADNLARFRSGQVLRNIVDTEQFY